MHRMFNSIIPFNIGATTVKLDFERMIFFFCKINGLKFTFLSGTFRFISIVDSSSVNFAQLLVHFHRRFR